MRLTKNILIITVVILVQLASSLQVNAAHDIEHQFCWKDSYGRGVGTIPDNCGHRQRLGLLCYDQCPLGYSRKGLDCHQNCPSGFRDDGLFCRNAEYGRGGGFPWKFRDGFNDRGMYRRCQSRHGRGNCQKNGAIVYPKCRPGFHNVGCCICRPSRPNCRAMGMNGGFDLSCAKYIKIGTPHSANCPPGKQNNAGLCYPACRQGYYGVGPVCWAKAPQDWVGCGMGAAISSEICAEIIVGQISSVGQIALNIATLGTSGAASSATNAAKNVGKIAKLKKQLQTLKNAIKGNKQIKKLADVAKKAKQAKKRGEKIQKAYEKAAEAADAVDQLEDMDEDNITEADIVRISAQIASLADPTGIASTIEAYSHPKCSQIFDD